MIYSLSRKPLKTNNFIIIFSMAVKYFFFILQLIIILEVCGQPEFSGCLMPAWCPKYKVRAGKIYSGRFGHFIGQLFLGRASGGRSTIKNIYLKKKKANLLVFSYKIFLSCSIKHNIAKYSRKLQININLHKKSK